MRRPLLPWFLGSLLAHLLALVATWRWYDADEFVNLQQAVRANAGLPLYLETPSHHPPLYVELLLRPILGLPGNDLLAARLASVLLAWGAGVLLADIVRRRGGEEAAKTVVALWSLNAFILLAGSRAMNEVPTLFLLMLGLWHMEAGRRPAVAGIAAGLALLTRLSSLYFLPALILPHRRRALRFGLAAAASILIPLALYVLLHPGAAPAFWQQAFGFHLTRTPEQGLRRLGKALWWSGVPAIALLLALFPTLRRLRSTADNTIVAVLAGSLLMVTLPSVHVHYLLPAAPALVAVAALGIHASPRNAKRSIGIAVAILVPLTQAVFYMPMVPQPDLHRATEAATWIADHTPSGLPILADAPEHAILAGRQNHDGYYWSLQHEIHPERLAAALNETSLVVVSSRFGHYDRGYPPWFLESLDGYPCATIAGTLLYWTGVTGPAPEGVQNDCTS